MTETRTDRKERKPATARLALPLASSLAAVFFLAACEPQPELPAEEIVQERALARWGHMVERDFEHAWDYYSPGFRNGTPREDFVKDMNRRPIRWKDAEFLDTECDGDRCKVRVNVTYRAIAAPHGQSRMEMTRPLEENWVRLHDEWWYSAN